MQDKSRNRTDINPGESLSNPNAPGHHMRTAQREQEMLRQRRQAYAGGLLKFILWTVLIILGCVVVAYLMIQSNPEIIVQELLGSGGPGGPPTGGDGL